MKYGLIGYPLEHSFSKIIHEMIGDYTYDLVPLMDNEFESFMETRDFVGINVTIPYKIKVVDFLDFLDESVKITGSCNTVVNQNGKLWGYNTDYYGFEYLLKKNKISLENKVVLILGAGGTYNTLNAVCNKHQAKEVYCYDLGPTRTTIEFESIYDTAIDILINATPVGMYPKNQESILDIKKMKGLSAVVDVIYNPLSTKTVVEAKKMNIKATGGLLMLVAQAVVANAKFLNKQPNEGEIEAIYHQLMRTKKNIVLIGLPLSGKTTVGAVLAKMLGKEFVDLDLLIESKSHLKIKQIFKLKGEAHFRMLENQAVKSISQNNDLVIATGGGVVENQENLDLLKQNGFIVHVFRDFDKIKYDDNRPLCADYGDRMMLFLRRAPLYEKNSDFFVINHGSIKNNAKKIMEAFNESFSD